MFIDHRRPILGPEAESVLDGDEGCSPAARRLSRRNPARASELRATAGA
ncbi:hypothetical protein [Actinoplanes solisilvae]|nr:hypothetical protein [Actinoplanes solisilvae]